MTTTTTPTNADTQAKKVLDNVYSTNSLTQEQKDYYNNNILNTPEARSKFLAMTDEERKSYMTNLSAVNILNRDTKLNTDYAKSEYDRKMADAVAQSELSKNKAKAELEANTNNFAIAQGTMGRGSSLVLKNAINSQLDITHQTYTNLVATNDRYIKALADEYQYNNTKASNEYNDNMNKVSSDLRNQIETLQATGAMQTAGGLIQAKNMITATLQA